MASFLEKYKILPPLFGFVFGVTLAEHLGNEWLAVALLSPVLGVICFIKPKLAFLIFIPIGILFSARPNLPENHVLHFAGKGVGVEGVLFKSPESRKKGSRLFIDVRNVFTEGGEEQASGKIIITTEERILGLAYGDRVRVMDTRLKSLRSFKNPGSFDFKRYYERQGIYATGFVPGEDWIISFGKDKSSNSFVHSVDRLRVKFGNFARNKSSFPESEVLNAITIGDQGGIPPELRNRFSEAGVAHVLSISGLHVGAVALVFYVLIKWVLKRSEFLLLRFQVPRLTAALTVVPVFVYMVVAGFATPVVRAFIMVSVYLISVVIGREENKLNTLAVSAFIILLWHPWAIFELSFQLSFASVFGILIMHRLYPFKLKSFEDKVISSVKTTLAASFATFPFIVNSFGIFSPVSVPANLISVPLVEFLIVPIGLVSFLAFLISESVARFFLSADVLLIKLFIRGTREFLEIPFSSLTVPSLGALSWTFYVLASTAFLLTRTYRKLVFIFLFFIVGFLAVSTYALLNNSNKGYLKLSFPDAGNRNAVLIELPQKKTILVNGGFSYYDGGGYIETGVMTPFLLKSGITKIDYLILTSLDRDHLEGAKAILQKFRVERFWTNGRKLDGELWEIIKDKKISWKDILDDVETLEIDGVKVEFLKLRGGFAVRDSSQPYPLLGKLEFRGVDFLFGEAINEETVQRELVEIYGDRVRSDILYMPRVSWQVTSNFVKTVSPRIVIVNTASGSFSGMTDMMRNYNFADSKPGVFQTEARGTVTVVIDGKQIRVRTYLDGSEEFAY